MIITIKQAHVEVSALMTETFSKECEIEAKTYRSSLSARGVEEKHMKSNRKSVPVIAETLYKLPTATEARTYTNSLPVEMKAALIERFILFLEELQNQGYKKIELPYSRNHRLKLILVDFSFGNSSVAVKHRH